MEGRINLLAGKAQNDDGFRATSQSDVYEKFLEGGGPHFLMPSADGSLKPVAIFHSRTFFAPDKGAGVDIKDQLTTYTGLPVQPFDFEEGTHTLTITAFRGYYPKRGKLTPTALEEMTVPDKVFKAEYDALFREFLASFVTNDGYVLEQGPTKAELKRMMAMIASSAAKCTALARSVPNYSSLEETALIISPSDVMVPSRYKASGDTPIVIDGGKGIAKLVTPNEFSKTVVRLNYMAWFETCKYFGLGEVAPLLFVAYCEAYGTSGSDDLDVGVFLETILSRINDSGTYPYTNRIIENQSQPAGGKLADTEAVSAIVAELFEAVLLYAVFVTVSQAYGESQASYEIQLEWYHEYDTEYGGQIFTMIKDNMKFMGVPGDAEGKAIKAWPFLTFEGEDVKGDDASFSLRPIYLAKKGHDYQVEEVALTISAYGWDLEGSAIVPMKSIPASFDPQLGWTLDTRSPAFLDITMRGDAWAGWLRDSVIDAPQMYKLGLTRVANHRFTPGFGPMKVTDHIIGRRSAFSGNIVPFSMIGPSSAFCCVPGTFIIDPAKVKDRLPKPQDLKKKKKV